MRLLLTCTSVIFWKLLLISQVTVTFSRMVPYYLGDTLIMVDSFDSNLPIRTRPSSDDKPEVVREFHDNYSTKFEDNFKDNFDNNHIESVKVLSDIISTANENNDLNLNKNVYTSNRVKFAPTIIIKDKNNNIVEHSNSKNAGDVSYNGIVKFINKPQSSITVGNTDTPFQITKVKPDITFGITKVKPNATFGITEEKPDIKVTFIDPNANFEETDTNVKAVEDEPNVKAVEDEPGNSMSSSKINANTNSNESTNSEGINRLSSAVIKSPNRETENINSNLVVNVDNANDVTEKGGNANSTFKMEDTTNDVQWEYKYSTVPKGSSTAAGNVGNSVSDNLISIDKSTRLNENSKVVSKTAEDVKELSNQSDVTKAHAQISDIESLNQDVDKDKVELLGNIEETLNNYFKADNEHTRTETLHRKLQKILNFLKKEEIPTNPRNFNYFEGFKGLNFGKFHRTKRDIGLGKHSILTRREGNEQVPERYNNLRNEKENSIESIEFDALSVLNYMNPTSSMEDESVENLDNNRVRLESNKDEDDNNNDSEMDEIESVNSSIESHGIPPRRISEGEKLPIRTDDYIDYDVDYYDYFDFSNSRVDPSVNDSEIIDEFINSSMNEFGNFTEVDEFGNYVDINDSGNYTDTDEYDTDNSTNSVNATIVTSVEDIDNLELLLSKKTCRCGVPISKTNIKRIIKGQDTTISKYPWMVQLAEKRDRLIYCGGSIITDLHIVTAAHCVVGYRPKELFVRMGETNATNRVGGTRALIKSIIIHPKYRSRDGTKYDIAILRLRRPIKYTESVLPVCLQSLQDNEGKTGTIIGWGSTSESSGMVAPILQETEVSIMEADTCKNESGYKQYEIPNRVFCARGNGTDSCQGDSGGPLLIEEESQYYLAGITSWGVGCGLEQYPGVYTKVALYTGWIRVKTRDALYCQPDGRNQIRKLSVSNNYF